MGKRGSTAVLSASTEEQIAAALDGQPDPEAGQGETSSDSQETGLTVVDGGKVKKEKAPPREFAWADPVETLGRLLIGQNYPDLQGVRIVYVFTNKPATQEGEAVIASVSKVQGVIAWLAQLWDGASESTPGEGDPFFLIIVSQSHWDLMGQRAREAVVDDALWQCAVRDSGALYVRSPDVKTSVDVVHRHGLYTNKLKDLGQVAKRHIENPKLFEEGGK